MQQINDLNNKRVIALLVNFNELLLKITKLKLKNRQALGLLADALQINKQMLSLLRNNKTNIDFVKQIIVVIISFVRDTVSKWLFRYKLTPLWRLEYKN